MQIVIDIPDKTYEYFAQGLRYADDVEMAIVAIVDGTQLPKGHGRLIDADAVLAEPFGNTYKDIEIAETIIEADKESEE